jgi:hypothetical protein
MADAFELANEGDPFEHADIDQIKVLVNEMVHRIGGKRAGHPCRTDGLGYATPDGKSEQELRVDSHLGFVPLWAPETTLRWRFQEQSLAIYRNPEAAKAAIRLLMSEALAGWGDSVPVKFSEQRDLWDFEVVVRANADCDASGCVLASAFFPDPGRHELVLYPTLFGQSRGEQVETLQHEFGHVFGLRHWFANVREQSWPSELFGTDSRFSIMNYGADSKLTDVDLKDLKALYTGVWSGQIREINGTKIQLMKPYHSFFSG